MVDQDLQISGGAVIHGQTLSKRGGGGGVNKIFFGPWGLSLVKNKQVDQNEHFRLLDLVQLQLRSASESIQPVWII